MTALSSYGGVERYDARTPGGVPQGRPGKVSCTTLVLLLRALFSGDGEGPGAKTMAAWGDGGGGVFRSGTNL